MNILLIRHGMTLGNLSGRYVGTTDESLCAEGISAVTARVYPDADAVIVSPMQRCIETAALIYPHIHAHVVEDFRECDFGAFEYKNYAELDGNADYQAWVDSFGQLPFPGGERREDFIVRCCAAFECAVNALPGSVGTVAMVVHGGTIMAILSRMAVPHHDYYHWQVKNGEGFVLRRETCSVERLALPFTT